MNATQINNLSNTAPHNTYHSIKQQENNAYNFYLGWVSFCLFDNRSPYTAQPQIKHVARLICVDRSQSANLILDWRILFYRSIWLILNHFSCSMLCGIQRKKNYCNVMKCFQNVGAAAGPNIVPMIAAKCVYFIYNFFFSHWPVHWF